MEEITEQQALEDIKRFCAVQLTARTSLEGMDEGKKKKLLKKALDKVGKQDFCRVAYVEALRRMIEAMETEGVELDGVKYRKENGKYYREVDN